MTLGDNVMVMDYVEQLVIGTVLGDASLKERKKNPRLSVGHRLEDIGYLEWKYGILKCAGLTKGPIYYTKNNLAILSTVSSPYLWKYKRLFYKNGHKILSREVLELLTPFSLAVWYMDDGNFTQRSNWSARLKISTDGFLESEVRLASEVISWKFNVLFNVHHHKEHWILQMSKGEMIAKFLAIVRPYIHPAMARKCPNFSSITPDILSAERSARAKRLWQDPVVRERILLARRDIVILDPITKKFSVQDKFLGKKELV